MILLTSNLIGEYHKASEKHSLDEVINTKRFTVGDSKLTYRQTNSLDASSLLDNDRENKKGWRKFSYKDLLYFEIVFILKEFGIKHEQLKLLWETFYKEPSKDKKQVELVTKTDGEMAIFCVFSGIEITLLVDAQGNVLLSDPAYLMRLPNIKPQIRISLNEIINKLNAQVGFAQVPVQYTMQDAIHNNFSLTTSKEKELLKIIRDKDYSVIKVKKKDGVIAVVYAEKNTGKSEMTPEDLKIILATKEYQNISIVQRDGKIVNYTLEDTIKL